MKVTVKISFDGCRKIEVDTKQSDTVADVIAKIRTQEDIESKIHLNLFRYSKLLNESNKISDFSFSSNGSIHPLTLTTVGPCGKIQIIVNIDSNGGNKRIKVNVNGTDTIANVVKTVGAKGSIPIETAQNMYFAGISMNNNHNLSYYGIGNNSEITISLLNHGQHFQIFVKTLTGQHFAINDVKRSDTVDTFRRKIQSITGTPLDMMILLYGGIQLKDGRTFSDYKIPKEATIHLLLRLRGMISTFTSSDTANSPLVSYLMKSDEERAQALVPIAALRYKAQSLCADNSSTFRYQEDPDLLHESQLDLLCDLIDFMWAKTAALTDNAGRVDMRLTLTYDQLGRVSWPQ